MSPPPTPLADAFLEANLRGGRPNRVQLERQLRAAVGDAEASYPELEVDPTQLCRDLGRLLADVVDPAAVLPELRIGDLWLCQLCLRGDPRALREFERRIVDRLDGPIGKMGSHGAMVEEVKQRVREKLLVERTDRSAKLTAYGGRGSLRSWVRVVAVREALVVAERYGREVPSDDEAIGDVLGADLDPELAFLKSEYRAEFRDSFAEALASLRSRDRTLLRLQHIDGLTLDGAAGVFGVHRATIARWNARARQQLLDRTREALMRRLRVDAMELESIMRLIQSNLEVSVRRLLRSE